MFKLLSTFTALSLALTLSAQPTRSAREDVK